MKVLFENLDEFIDFLEFAESKSLFYSIRTEVSELMETEQGTGRIYRTTILLQAITSDGLALHPEIVEQFVKNDKDEAAFNKAVEKRITEIMDEIKQQKTDLAIYKGVVEP